MTSFSWVIPGELAGMGLPWDLEAALAALKAQGVGAVVSLTERPIDARAVRRAGLAFLHVPVADMTAPSADDVARFVTFTEARIAEGRAVVAHCLAGRGRTGAMLACFLVHRGRSADAAIATVRSLRPGSIETPEQEAAVHTYARELGRA